MKKKEVTELYRIEYGFIWDDNFFSNEKLILKVIKFPVIKETNASYQIVLGHKLKWVRKNATVSYAYDKIQDARRNFIKRNQKRQIILETNLKNVKQALKLIENFHKPKTKKVP